MRLLGYCTLFSLLIVGILPADSPVFTSMAPPPESIITDDNYTAEELVEDIFVAGACNNIMDIQSIGSTKGIGYFENGLNSIGIERGIILSTGKIDNARGPNNVTDESGNLYDESGDVDLNALASGPVKDAVGIAFDFVPLDSFVSFTYVFASEEYCEFVGSIYNDVFGFFISGPGINGTFSNNAENVALLPGSNVQVSINTINHQVNAGYYRHNELDDDMEICNITSNPTTYHEAIEYDGFTQKLTAALQLIPCETYHIRLVVADVGDNFYDSAVFLEAESFNLGGRVLLNPGIGVSASAPALEGCNDAFFSFERADPSNNSFPISVNYIVSASGSAEAGIDFLPLPGNISIPAGSNTAQLPVQILNDGIAEPVEDIVLVLDIPCACYSDSARMYIHDSPSIEVELPDITICENGSGVLSPVIEGGSSPYSYSWHDGSSAATLVVQANGPNDFAVTITDRCGNTDNAEASMSLTPPPSAQLSGEALFCEGDTAFFPLQLTGVAPWTISYTIDGIAQAPLENIGPGNSFLPATQGGLYEITNIVDAACEGSVSGSAYAELLSIQADIQTQMTSCYGGADGAISVQLYGGTPPYSYSWEEGYPSQLELAGLQQGWYHLEVVDSFGCYKSFPIAIESPAPIEAALPDCEDLSMGVINIAASGGTPPYVYAIDGINYTDESLFDELEGGTSYTLSIQDAAGCAFIQDFVMPVPYSKMLELPPSVEFSLGSQQTLTPVLNIPANLIASLRWTPSVHLSCIDCLTPELLVSGEEVYTVRVVDIYGCTDEASIRININNELDVFAPTAFSPNQDNVNDRYTLFANTYQVVEIEELSIFDRWGDLIFRNTHFAPNDDMAGWDGTYKGKLLDPGVFTYYARVRLLTGESRVIGGHFILMR
jgi:gliding motility-associated-like protein